jgi:hypothetical protein
MCIDDDDTHPKGDKAMNKLVLHHTYVNGLTFDVSRNGNSGIPISVIPGDGQVANSFTFNGDTSRINVRPSASLMNLVAVKVSARFYLTATLPWRRFNIIEGHLSFALFINPDGSIEGTILDHHDNWTGALSEPWVVTPKKWHEITFEHDGVNSAQITFDGKIIAATYNVQGPVRSVGPEGIAIGHWPGQPSTFTFMGNITEVKLWKYDPREDARMLLDPCCVDRKLLDKAYLTMKSRDWNHQKLEASLHSLIDAASQYAGAIRGGDPVKTADHKNIGTAILGALLRGDGDAYLNAVNRAATQARENLPAEKIEALEKPIIDTVKSLPFSLEELQEYTKSLCLKAAHIDPKSVQIPDPGRSTHQPRGARNDPDAA